MSGGGCCGRCCGDDGNGGSAMAWLCGMWAVREASMSERPPGSAGSTEWLCGWRSDSMDTLAGSMLGADAIGDKGALAAAGAAALAAAAPGAGGAAGAALNAGNA
jgi:hypothetical protein